jgi:hypothetical protein
MNYKDKVSPANLAGALAGNVLIPQEPLLPVPAMSVCSLPPESCRTGGCRWCPPPR